MNASTRLVPMLSIGLALASPAFADWTNFGGNAARNGISSEIGPTEQTLLWENTDDFSIISWHPVILGARAYAIRESAFPSAGGSAAVDPIHCYDLDTGEVLWTAEVPYAGDPEEEWIAYIGGANDGRVYAARGGSERTTPVYAFDAVSGDFIWDSDYETVAGPQDGFIFAPNGDIIVGDFDNIVRISEADGDTVWETPRLCSVSGNCGGAATNDAIFIVEPVPGGHVISKFDLDSGAFLYSSPIMAGFTAQNTCFLSEDGSTVYFARSQNNPPFDNLYAFADTGTEFVELWNRPVRWTTSHEHGIGSDGTIYTFTQSDEFVGLDPATGDIRYNAGVLSPLGSPNLSPRTAVDANGTVYISNGWANTPATNGRVWAFSADLSTNYFTLELDRVNSGGPSLGASGTLIVSDRQGVYAYRTEGAVDCLADLDASGDVGFADLLIVLDAWGEVDVAADLDGGGVGFSDLLIVLDAWGRCAT